VLDALALGEGCRGSTEINIGRGQVAQDLLIVDVVIEFGEGVDLPFEIASKLASSLASLLCRSKRLSETYNTLI
jgi:hypothetical protein